MSSHFDQFKLDYLNTQKQIVVELTELVGKVSHLLSRRYEVSEHRIFRTIGVMNTCTPLCEDIVLLVVSFIQQEIFEQELKRTCSMLINTNVALRKVNNKLMFKYSEFVPEFLVNYNMNALPSFNIVKNLELSKEILFAVRKDIIFRRKHGWYAICMNMNKLQLLTLDANKSLQEIQNFFDFVYMYLTNKL